ncbi:histidinol-phosphate transaminase [Desulfotomaculum copahuensis]|uniref:Histidinol-phosphate aminotransferase n=1 Tax=Desulfotomaculum copahuensis TaxID=1838280 RepID=A0A1B7LG11_9FIRM|nr:histidinol-phosphate transaminase [Desulfotomaculum copahuensis]OAT83664.1 histidinol-phosphate transaminase [Desulfotomaculum copahuensis]
MIDSFDPAELLRPDLRELVPYEAPVHPGAVKLDANENPYDLPATVREEIASLLRDDPFNRYPDPLAIELRQELAAYTGLPAECIMAGNGADELIQNLMLAFGGGGRVVIATPTFSMYRIHAVIAGAMPVSAPRRTDFSLDPEVVIAAAGHPATRLVFLCSPNNPTGNVTPPAEAAAILANTRALVVVDEAYLEFGGESCLPLLEGYPNLVMLRTMSKAFGLAGLRVGYLLGSPAVVRQLLRIKQPFNLNRFSQLAARAALAHRAEFEALIRRIRENRQALYDGLNAVPGVTAFPSEANFILFRTPLPAGDVYHGLLAGGVLIRNMHGPGLQNCLRVTVGREDENRLFLEKLKLILGG